MRYNIKNQQGQSLLELLVAMAVFVLVVSSIMFLVLDAHQSNRQGGERTKAALIAQEGSEAALSIKERGWRYLQEGDYGIDDSGGYWDWQGNSNAIDKFTRRISVEPVYRNGDGDIVQTGGTVDFDTKKITSEVTWEFMPSRPSEVIITSYETNWRSQKWMQTTQADFDQGTKNDVVSTNVNGGELQLLPGVPSFFGNRFLVEAIAGVGDMDKPDKKTALRFTAQDSTIINTIKVYLEIEQGVSPIYRYGLQLDVGGQPSGVWLGSTNQGYGDWQATSTGWQLIGLKESVSLTAGQVYHLVIEWQSGIVNKNNYINLRASSPLNHLIPYDNREDSNAGVLWNRGGRWLTSLFQPIYILGFTDGNFEGNPYTDFIEEAIYENRFIGEDFSISGGNKEVSQIDFYVGKNSKKDPADDLYVTLYDVTDSVQIERGVLVTSLNVTENYEWYSYGFPSVVTLQDNHQYRIYLSSPDSNNQQYYQVYQIYHQDQIEFNAINYGGVNSVLTASEDGGIIWDNSKNADTGGFRFIIPTGYAISGDFISSAFDTQSDVTVHNYIDWTVDEPAGTRIQWQLRTANTEANLSAATWVGSDGTSDMFYMSPGELIEADPSATGTQWIQYMAYFYSDSISTPILRDITIDYEI